MTSEIKAFEIICKLVTDGSIAKILNSQNNSVLRYGTLENIVLNFKSIFVELLL